MNLESLRSLQARIREANGADRALDAEIAITLRLIPGPPWKIYADANGTRIACHTLSGTEVALRDFNGYITIPKFTTDPDGLGPCVGLMREVLPGYVWGKFLDGNFELAGPPGTRTIYSRVLSSECLTFLDAILSALIAQEEARHTEKAG